MNDTKRSTNYGMKLVLLLPRKRSQKRK